MQIIIKEDTDNQRNMHNFVQGFIESKTSGYSFVKNSASYNLVATDEYFVIANSEKFNFFSIQDIVKAVDEHERIYFTASSICFMEEGKLLDVSTKKKVKGELLIHATAVLGIYIFILKGKHISNKCKDTKSIRTSKGMESLQESIFSYATEVDAIVETKYFCSTKKLTFDIFRDDVKNLITQPLEDIFRVVTALPYSFNNKDKTIELDLNTLKGGTPFNMYVKGNVSLAMPFECTIFGV